MGKDFSTSHLIPCLLNLGHGLGQVDFGHCLGFGIGFGLSFGLGLSLG